MRWNSSDCRRRRWGQRGDRYSGSSGPSPRIYNAIETPPRAGAPGYLEITKSLYKSSQLSVGGSYCVPSKLPRETRSSTYVLVLVAAKGDATPDDLLPVWIETFLLRYWFYFKLSRNILIGASLAFWCDT